MMRLRERGVTHLHGRGRGDEYVRINVTVPEKLNHNQKSIVEEMKEEGL
jgi:molecular chaperone DnaJ